MWLESLISEAQRHLSPPKMWMFDMPEDTQLSQKTNKKTTPQTQNKKLPSLILILFLCFDRAILNCTFIT